MIMRPPESMQKARRWVMWRYELDEKREKLTKIPYQANAPERKASSTNASTWVDYHTAIQALDTGKFDGIGFCLGWDDDINKNWIGIDWDDQHPDTIMEEILSLGSYAELSPSGNGAHVIAWGTKPGKKARKSTIEIYDWGRYFTVTGNHIRGTPEDICDIDADALHDIYHKIDPMDDLPTVTHTTTKSPDLSDDEIIDICQAAANSSKFNALWRGSTAGYSSPSEADQALCNILAFYTQDEIQLNRLMRMSGLYREKWDRIDYADRTMKKAIAGLRDTYSPEYKQGMAADLANEFLEFIKRRHGGQNNG